MQVLTVDAPRDALVGALEANLWSLWSNFGRGPGCELYEEEDATWFGTPLRVVPYHAVLRFQAEQDAGARVEELLDYFRRRDAPSVWIVHPSSRPAALPALLDARGLALSEVVPGMVADLARMPATPALPPGFEILEAAREDELRDIFELIAWRWGLPESDKQQLHAINAPFDLGTDEAQARIWLARRDGVPVAKVVLHLAAGVAGLYGVATRPEARGQGLAKVLTLLAFQAAREAGYRLAVLHSTPMAVPLYERLGFRSVAEFRLFASGGLSL